MKHVKWQRCSTKNNALAFGPNVDVTVHNNNLTVPNVVLEYSITKNYAALARGLQENHASSTNSKNKMEQFLLTQINETQSGRKIGLQLTGYLALH